MVAIMELPTTPLFLAAVPIMGAMVGLVFWSQPERLRIWSLLVTLLSLLTIFGMSGRLTVTADGLLLLHLIPPAACVAILGQPVHRDHRLAWVMTLLFLGLGLGVLTSQHFSGRIALIVLLGLITLLLYRQRNPFWPPSWWGIGTYGFGAFCVGFAEVGGPPASSIASVLACAILLPLAPFHGGYVAALTRLPGSLPSFIVLLLPAIGLHDIAPVIPAVPDGVTAAMMMFSLAGALYGSVKALAQSRIRLLLVYGSFSFFSLVWWFASAPPHVSPQAAVFVGAVAFVTSGLLLAWQVIRTRYGDDVDPQAISGLARTMPQFAVLLSLLGLAAMGLPPFGVFAGLMGLLLTSSHGSAAASLVIVIVWVAASWYILDMTQRLLFRRQRPELLQNDLYRSEFASLLIIVLIVIGLGVAPISLVGIDHRSPLVGAVMESISWIR